MKRILLPIGEKYTPLFELSLLSKIAGGPSVIVYGIFLAGINSPKQETAEAEEQYAFPNDLSLTAEVDVQAAVKVSGDLKEDQIKLFIDECEAAGFTYFIEKEVSIERFVNSTLESDLVIAHSGDAFLKEVLPGLRCPAYLVSQNAWPEQVVVLYDGSSDGRYAIERYLTFLPEWQSFPTTIVSVNQDDSNEASIRVFFDEYLAKRFGNIHLQFLKGDKEALVTEYLQKINVPSLVVMGAFGRSAFSRFFRGSLATVVMQQTSCDLFIAHESPDPLFEGRFFTQNEEGILDQ